MLHNLNSTFAIAIDMDIAGKLAVAGPTTMDAQAGIVADGPVAH